MSKQELYSEFINRMKTAELSGNYLEASWYAYAVLEDRLCSLLRNSGGETNANGKLIMMMGPKLGTLEKRAKKDPLLNVNFEHVGLKSWTKNRNSLMHAMANASMTLTQIDIAANALAKDGAKLVREYSASCRRLKRHRKKV